MSSYTFCEMGSWSRKAYLPPFNVQWWVLVLEVQTGSLLLQLESLYGGMTATFVFGQVGLQWKLILH